MLNLEGQSFLQDPDAPCLQGVPKPEGCYTHRLQAHADLKLFLTSKKSGGNQRSVIRACQVARLLRHGLKAGEQALRAKKSLPKLCSTKLEFSQAHRQAPPLTLQLKPFPIRVNFAPFRSSVDSIQLQRETGIPRRFV